MEKTSFEGEVQIDKVINSLNALKTSLYNVNYLNKIIQQNKEEIINAGEYASVIRPIIENKFLVDPKFSIYNISKDRTTWNDGKCYYSVYNNWINKLLNNSIKIKINLFLNLFFIIIIYNGKN